MPCICNETDNKATECKPDAYGHTPLSGLGEARRISLSANSENAPLKLHETKCARVVSPIVLSIGTIHPVILVGSAAVLLILGVSAVAPVHDRRMEKKRLQSLKKWVQSQTPQGPVIYRHRLSACCAQQLRRRAANSANARKPTTRSQQ